MKAVSSLLAFDAGGRQRMQNANAHDTFLYCRVWVYAYLTYREYFVQRAFLWCNRFKDPISDWDTR